MRLAIFLLILCLHSSSSICAIIYVDQDAIGTDNGSSWANAYAQVYDAIDNATAGDEIWIAEGFYLAPPDGSVMNVGFSLRIYGGFSGSESLRAQRDWSVNATVISGNIGNIALFSDNSESIIRFDLSSDATVVIDGVTFRDTYSTSTSYVISGSSIQTNHALNVEINHCIFIANNTGCIFTGLNYTELHWTIANCLFTSNSPTNSPGVYTRGGVTDIINCTLYNTDALFILDGQTNVYNSIFWGNDVPQIDAYRDATVYIENSIVDSIEYCSYELCAILDLVNVLSGDPMFVDPVTFDFNLDICSPAIDEGNNAYLIDIYDLAYQDRSNGLVDLGCYEYQSASNVVFVDTDATGNNNGSSWTDAYSSLDDAVANTPDCAEIWVAEGVYTQASTLAIDRSIKLFGGFSGIEASKSNRNWDGHATIISGDAGAPGLVADNITPIIVFEDGADETHAVIDGFIIEDSYGGSALIGNSLASLSSIAIRNCIIRNNNSFAAATVFPQNADWSFSNSLFYGNTSTGLGACIYTNGASTATISLVHCTIAGNNSEPTASMLRIGNFNVEIDNCIIRDPVAEYSLTRYGTGIAKMHACIALPVSGDFIEFENVQNTSPMFNDPANDDFFLQECSPAIDAANPSYSKGQYDLSHLARISGDLPDIGCYERQINPGSTIYVDLSAAGANNGSSWSNAYNDLQDALAAAGEGDEIWVATGSYKPATVPDPTISFVIDCGVSLFGGFDGTEVLKSQRDIEANPTTLTGNIPGIPNAHHIITINDYKAYAQIDGFTIKFGSAGGAQVSGGGAMLLTNFSGLIDQCTFINNTGGNAGAIQINQSINGEIRNCQFTNNSTTTTSGGAILMQDSDIEINNCTFEQNTSASDGGALIISRSICVLTNCVFDDNQSTGSGGALLIMDSSIVTSRWCTFVDNSAQSASGSIQLNTNSRYETINSVYWQNTSTVLGTENFGGITDSLIADHCIIENGWAMGTNIIDSAPLFTDPGVGNFIPGQCSPAIDAGRVIGKMPATDIRGASRSIGKDPDIGAYENKFPYYFDGKAGPDSVTCEGSNLLLYFDQQQRDTSLTALSGTDLKSGIFFDVVPKENMVLKRIHGHWIEGNPGLATRVWVKWRVGSWYDAQLDQTLWEDGGALAGVAINSTLGTPSYMVVDYLDIALEAGRTYGFYVYLDEYGGGPAQYVRTQTPPASGFGDLQEEFAHLSVNYGRSTASAPWGALSPFAAAFEGGFTYTLYDSIQWSDGAQVIGNTQSLNISPDSATYYYLTMYDVTGCDFTDTVFVDVTYPPDNNTCNNATPLLIDAPFIDGTTRCASGNAQTIGSCNTNVSPTVWYSVIGTESGKFQIRVGDVLPYTTNLNIKILLFTGMCGNLTEMACIDETGNNENENVVIDGIIEGQTYYIAVRGANTQQGGFRIQVKDPCVEAFSEQTGLGEDTVLCYTNDLLLSSGVPFKDTLHTAITNGDTAHGFFFDIVALSPIRLHRIVSHFVAGVNLSKDVYYRKGSHVGYKSDMSAWTFAGTGAVSPGGIGGQVVEVPVDLDLLLITGDTLALYFYGVIGDQSIIMNTANGSSGDVVYDDGRLQILNGKAMAYPAFGGGLIPGAYNLSGALQYELIEEIQWRIDGAQYSLDEHILIEASQEGAWTYKLEHVNGCISRDTQNVTMQDNIVRNTNDAGLYSLRDAIGCLADFDTIFFHPFLNTDTIKLTGSQIHLDFNNSTIQGRGALLTIISAEGSGRVFQNLAGSLVNIKNLSLINGMTSNFGGGAIKNDGDLFLTNVRLNNNTTTQQGGALLNSVQATLNNVIFSTNSAAGAGKHIYNTGVLTVLNGVELKE